MTKYLILILALLTTAVAYADTFLFTWLAPIERIDDSPLLPEEIDHYTLYLNDTPVETITAPTTAVQLNITKPGNYSPKLTVTDTEGRESTMVVAGTVTVAKKTPQPPRNFRVERLTQ